MVIEDLFDYFEKDKIKIIPLQKNKKEPIDKGYYDKKYSVHDLRRHKGNFGVCVGYNHNKTSLAVVDIDGLNGDFKKESQLILFNALKDIPGLMQVKTQSGGYHLYCWNKYVLNNFYEYTKDICFPSDCSVPELRGVAIYHGIEIFTKWHSKYVVLPGSSVKIKGSSKINKYDIVNDVKLLSDILVFDNIGETIRETLIDNGFTIKEKKTSVSKVETITKNTSFNKGDIKKLLDILIPAFKKIDGMRQDCYMALNGYLLRYLPVNICKRIVYGLAQACGDEELNKRLDTVDCTNKCDGPTTGLPTLLENFSSVGLNSDKLEFLIRKIVQSDFKHYIPIEDGFQRKVDLEIDFANSVINEVVYKSVGKKNDFGETEYVFKRSNTQPIVSLRPDHIFESYNILERNIPPQLCFRFYRRGMPYPITLMNDNILSIEKELEGYSGVVLRPRKYKGVLSILVNEYQRLGLLDREFNAPVTGLFINPKTNELVRSVKSTFACEDTGLADIVGDKPSPDEVYGAVDVWRRLGELYKGDINRLSHIIRWGLLCPFSYILKQVQSWVPMLFLFGVSNTAKTMLGEIALCPYVEINDNNSLGGASMSSPYRAGETFRRSSLGCVVNEPGTVLENDDLLDLIKRGVESTICREKMENGRHVQIPSYNNILWTSNSYVPVKDAFIKRTEILEFDINDRMTGDDKELFVSTFHHLNWSDTDFLKLRKVGDFIIWYVYNNKDLLYEKHDVIVNKLLDELFRYSGHEVLDWLYCKAEIKDFDDTDNNILIKLRKMLLDGYRRLPYHVSCDNISEYTNPVGSEKINDTLSEIGVENNVDVKKRERFKKHIINGISDGYFDYLFLNNSREHGLCIGFRTSVGEELKNFTKGELHIKWKTLAELVPGAIKSDKPFRITGTRKNAKGFVVPFNDFRRLME